MFAVNCDRFARGCVACETPTFASHAARGDEDTEHGARARVGGG